MGVRNEDNYALSLDILIQCDINPYRHQLNLHGDLVPWVCCGSHSKNLPTHMYIGTFYIRSGACVSIFEAISLSNHDKMKITLIFLVDLQKS